jgi:hypothetical protein
MLVEQALQVKLASTLTALVGTRVYYVKAPQNVTAPYVTLQKISQNTESVTSGKRYVEARFQISIFDVTYSSIKTIAAAIQMALDKFSGTMGGAGGLWINNCTYDNETDLEFDDTLKLYGLAVDYILMFEIAISYP